jgi:hypothetical protein
MGASADEENLTSQVSRFSVVWAREFFALCLIWDLTIFSCFAYFDPDSPSFFSTYKISCFYLSSNYRDELRILLNNYE